MLKRSLLLLAVLACGAPSAAVAPTDDPGVRLDVYAGAAHATLLASDYSGLKDSLRLVVRDARTWTRVWNAVHAGVTPAPRVVAPDFGEEIAVVAALGQRRTGGYGIRVDSVARHAAGAVVYVTTTAPGRNCLTTQALTSPVHAVRVPRIEGRVAWRQRAVVENCR